MKYERLVECLSSPVFRLQGDVQDSDRMEGSGGCNSTGPPTQASLDSRRGAAHSALGKFTIPRKKRGPENALLEDCLKESREHGGLVSALNECRLDVTGDFFLSWECLDVKLVNNVELAREFSEKRSEMRSKGRHGRELEDRFCFLVTSHTSALELCRNGVETDTSTPHVLGNPACGVHLYRHTDVALKCVTGKAASPRTVVVFKVILGKVKKVPSCVGRKAVHDPTVHFDCFMCRDPSSPRDSLSQQAVGSSVSRTRTVSFLLSVSVFLRALPLSVRYQTRENIKMLQMLKCRA
ncbi:protein TASOR [Amia ocellicauda]|uniref:protein TASOR n=1 Tax=Amia ocellicauda TaxID=2972642 RepID=UPI003464DAC0